MTNIPTPQGLPFIGHLHKISLQKTIQSLMQLAKKHGELFKINIIGNRMMLASSADVVKDLCDESRFQKYMDERVEHLRAIGGDGLATAWTHDPQWQKAHNILIPGLSQRSMRGYYPMMQKMLDGMFEKWDTFAPDHYFNLSDEIMRLTFDTIGYCGFDHSFHSFKKEALEPFILALTNCLRIAIDRSVTPKFLHRFQFRKNALFQKSVDEIFELVDSIIERRLANPEQFLQKTDFLSLMLNATDKESGTKLDPLNIRHQIMTFLSAGSETTNSLLAFAFYYLLASPEYLEKANQEVAQVIGTDPRVKPTYQQLQELTFIRQILQEALRLWPPVPLFQVYATKDTHIGTKQYPIKKGQSVSILVPALHRDPTIWGQHADTFNPMRFEPEIAAERNPFAYKPFGNGVRACIGRQFAMMEAMSAIACVLQRYKMRLNPDYNFDVQETLTLHPKPVEVAIEKRPEAEFKPPLRDQQKVHVPQDASIPQHQTPFVVFYGSNMGASEDLAYQMAKDAEARGFITQVHPLNAAKENWPKKGVVQVICSTYNGMPPDNATLFCDWLENSNPDLSGGYFAIFGCGNTQWSTFQKIPRWLDVQLEKMGAVRIYERGEADASTDFDGAFEDWYKAYWPTVFKTLRIGMNVAKMPPASSLKIIWGEPVQADLPKRFERQQSFQVLKNTELQSATSDRSTRAIQLRLPPAVTYEIGDHLAVIPKNSKLLIERVIKRFRLDSKMTLLIETTRSFKTPLPNGQSLTLQKLLAEYVELQAPITIRQLEKLKEYTQCPPEYKRIEMWLEPAYFNESIKKTRQSILDILEQLPACEIPFEAYLEMLPALAIRYYSVASSPVVQSHSCSLVVGVVEGEAWNKRGYFNGVCSSYLAGCQEGDSINAFIEKNTLRFLPPEDVSIPIIMVGAGTGLSPFMGFVEHRMHLAKSTELGEAALFFGCRHPEKDFIYKDILMSCQQNNMLKLYTAFSRMDNTSKTYVQDVLLKEQNAVLEWINKGAVIYVCGEGSTMAKGVENAFEKMLGQEQLEALKATNRYRVDAWG